MHRLRRRQAKAEAWQEQRRQEERIRRDAAEVHGQVAKAARRPWQVALAALDMAAKAWPGFTCIYCGMSEIPAIYAPADAARLAAGRCCALCLAIEDAKAAGAVVRDGGLWAADGTWLGAAS